MAKDEKQLELAAKFDPTWIRVMSSIIKTGDTLKEAGPVAFTVMCVLRAYKNVGSWGSTWPSVATIAERMGKSKITIHKALNKLEELGLITRKTIGRANTYELRELYPVGAEEDPKQELKRYSSPYEPTQATDIIQQVKEAVKTGTIPAGSVIRIEQKFNFQMNVFQDSSTGFVINSNSELDESIPPKFRKTAEKMMKMLRDEGSVVSEDIKAGDLLELEDETSGNDDD